MTMLRIAATALVVAALGALIYVFCYVPVLSSNAAFHLSASTDKTETLTDPTVMIVRARRDRAHALSMIERHPRQSTLYVVAARNSDILGRTDEALALTLRALEYDRRPGILLYAGTLYCKVGAREEAVRFLTAACLFDPVKRLLIPGNCLVPEVITAAEERQQMLERKAARRMQQRSDSRTRSRAGPAFTSLVEPTQKVPPSQAPAGRLRPPQEPTGLCSERARSGRALPA